MFVYLVSVMRVLKVGSILDQLWENQLQPQIKQTIQTHCLQKKQLQPQTTQIYRQLLSENMLQPQTTQNIQTAAVGELVVTTDYSKYIDTQSAEELIATTEYTKQIDSNCQRISFWRIICNHRQHKLYRQQSKPRQNFFLKFLIRFFLCAIFGSSTNRLCVIEHSKISDAAKLSIKLFFHLKLMSDKKKLFINNLNLLH